MTGLLAGLLILGLGVGALLVYQAFRPVDPDAAVRPPSQLKRRFTGLWKSGSRRPLYLLGGIAAGIVLWLITGWLVLLVAVPAAVAWLPALMRQKPAEREIKRLEALATWTRSLTGLISTGTVLENVLTASVRNAPEEIKPEVTDLVARLNAGVSPPAALRAFADDLDDATSDVLIAHLILAYKIRGEKLGQALEDIAKIMAEDVKHRREIETDREKPRATARLVTIISAAIVLGISLFGSQFLAVYKQPVGQILLFVYISGYAAILLWMQQMSRTRKAPRILVDEGRSN